jgi:16S rRNA (cytidine1402-2'-O)-methyltransferase
MSGKLSIIGTPIGNMEDISLRALRTLKEASVVYCEDTRVTKNLLDRYEISVPLRRCDAHKEVLVAAEIIEKLSAGAHVAYVSDAGTPGISDPGSRLVGLVRRELWSRIKDGANDVDAAVDGTVKDITIEAIPGASALTALVSISGMDIAHFVFTGFSPHKKGRETFFRETLSRDMATIFYESPHRLVNALERIATAEPAREVCVGRELTKIYEEVKRGPAHVVHAWYAEHPPKGECVVIVSGSDSR